MSSPGGLEAKALSDLDLARRIARGGPSGHELATAMCLAQQSLEKMLKSAVATFYEGARLGDGDGAARSLGHEIYPKMARLARDRAARAIAQGADSARADHAAQAYGQIACLWEGLAGSGRLQAIVWKASMGAADGGETSRLGSWLDCHMALVEGATGAPAAGWLRPKIPAPVPLPMEEAVRDEGRIEELRCVCAGEPGNAERRAMFRRGYGLNMARLGQQAAGPCDSGSEAHGKLARRSALEFCFQHVMSYHGIYMFLFPHGTFGRYPARMGGGLFTTDLYRSRLDYALHNIFVLVPFHVGELRRDTARLARLLDRGRGMGHW